MNHTNLYIGISIAILSLSVYFFTLCPTVYVGDSGELTAAAYTLGIAHPSGYPLLCLTGKIFTWIPVGNIAYRINLMSAFFAAAVVLMLYFLLLKLTANLVAASVGSLAFGFSQTFWSQANIGKSSYAINAFFLVSILLCLILWANARSKEENPEKRTNAGSRYLYLSGLLFGLGLANHHTLLMFLPLYFGFIILTQWKTKKNTIDKKQTKPKKKGNVAPKPTMQSKVANETAVYIKLLFFFLLGLVFYLYLPIRAHLNPPINWGIPDSWERFYAHLARKQYGSMSFNFSMPRTAELVFKQGIIYARLLFTQFTPFLFLFAPFGIYGIWKQNKLAKSGKKENGNSPYPTLNFFWLTIGIFVFYSLGLIILINYKPTTEDVTLAHVFLIPSYLVVAIWIAWGTNLISQYLMKYKYVTWLILLLPIIPLAFNYSTNNRRGIKFGEDYAKNVLSSLPDHAILFSIRDSLNFTLAYQKFVEKQRPDITIYDMSDGLFEDATGEFRKDKWRLSAAELGQYHIRFFQRLLAQNQNARPIFFEIPVDTTPFPGYVLKHNSFFYHLTTANDSTLISFNPNTLIDLDKYYTPRDKDSFIAKITNFYIREALVDYHFHLGRFYQEMGKLESAFQQYELAENIGSDFAQVHNNLGTIYYGLGKFDLALKEYQQAIIIDPLQVEAYYNIALYYNNILKDNDLAQYYYRIYESRQRK